MDCFSKAVLIGDNDFASVEVHTGRFLNKPGLVKCPILDGKISSVVVTSLNL